MILLYFKTSENGLKTLEKAVAENDMETISETAHKMAAPSKHLKADELYRKLKLLENAPENQLDANRITELFSGVKKEASEVIDYLKWFLNRWEAEQN
jgi:HPt (histidine-containing phosphotransfer) domain-containing protein